MKLKEEQMQSYFENGYLIIEKLFSQKETQKLQQNIKEFENLSGFPNIIYEDNGNIRSIFAPHKSNKLFDRLCKDVRLVEPSQQLIGDKIYLYQYKLNIKKAFSGDYWEWHQDFPFWHLDDKISRPLMTSVMILLQNTRSYQGSLMVIPTSHKIGLAKFQLKENLISKLNKDKSRDGSLQHSLNNDLKYAIAYDLVKTMADENEIINITGPEGTCIFFHPNLFHASNSNISPYDRETAIITYNSVNNLAEDSTNKRPDYICSIDTTEIVLCNNTFLEK